MTPKKEDRRHPYFSGNYAPIYTVQHSHPCEFQGEIPDELIGGQYVRNGSNSLQDDEHQDLHWFDGDGMLSGVFFKRVSGSTVRPLYSNRYILTDVHCATAQYPKINPILTSVTTLINPLVSPLKVFLGLLRSIALILSSFIGFVVRPVRRIGSANTNILFHDGRALATNEIGPPMRVYLPSLQTVGWFTGSTAEGEPPAKIPGPSFGGPGIEGFYNEMTTAHPRVDPSTGELLLFHSTFIFPFVHYSIVPPGRAGKHVSYLNQPVPGYTSGKLIHDFGVSRKHTIMLDLPISLDPVNMTRNKPIIEYNPQGHTRFGVFPRYCPAQITWYETDPCCIIHTVNSWDESVSCGTRVHMLVCRMNSAAHLYHMGNLDAPPEAIALSPECRLYYYQFPAHGSANITEQWALSAIPFEFPHIPQHLEMTAARFVYGCSMREGNFARTHKSSVKIDCIVKIDVQRLLQQAECQPKTQVTGCVDHRSIKEIIATGSEDDPIQVFALPHGWYAQECSFVPREGGTVEDDGWLVTYVFDESQLDANGNAPTTSRSELWVIDARTMRDIVARVLLPQRVPYGMHGNWFSEEQVLNQREIEEFRSLD
ncbi:carotenoid oxygenase family protein [Aspergillus alliaceus]|uniref:carotenoid oxygenase family protein n=1 Tax=Petromyces alliaceus TaxID=209559 RepID=UPI0012A535B3|nr:carotenoid oxygenase [Aspergillus alliaceus]KAB8237012.1 carotenoid oxygenase [Aspergillus alliaceus]